MTERSGLGGTKLRAAGQEQQRNGRSDEEAHHAYCTIFYNPGMEYDLEKLSKEIVVERLKDAEDPHQLAAEVARKIAISAVASTRTQQDPHMTVAAACRGVMQGILLLEKDLPKTAVALLAQMALVAEETNLDPAECMTWAMEGIAPICRLAAHGTGEAVGAAIEERFMGAGHVFAGMLRTAGS